MAPYLPKVSKARKERNWEPFFFSQYFLKEHKNIVVDDFALTHKRLSTLAIEVSKARERFEEAAKFAQEDSGKDKATKQKRVEQII